MSLIVIVAIGGLGYLGQSIRERMEVLTGEMEKPDVKMQKQTYQTMLAELTNGGLDEAQATRIATATASMAAAMLRAGYTEAQAAQMAKTAADAYVAAREMGQTEDQAKKTAIWATYEAAMDQAHEMYGENWEAIYTAATAAEKEAYIAFTGNEPTNAQLVYDRAYAATIEVATTLLTKANGPLSSEVIAAVIDLADDFAGKCGNGLDGLYTNDMLDYDKNTGAIKLKRYIPDLANQMELNYPSSSGIIFAVEPLMSIDLLPIFAAMDAQMGEGVEDAWTIFIYKLRMGLEDYDGGDGMIFM